MFSYAQLTASCRRSLQPLHQLNHSCRELLPVRANAGGRFRGTLLGQAPAHWLLWEGAALTLLLLLSLLLPLLPPVLFFLLYLLYCCQL